MDPEIVKYLVDDALNGEEACALVEEKAKIG